MRDLLSITKALSDVAVAITPFGPESGAALASVVGVLVAERLV